LFSAKKKMKGGKEEQSEKKEKGQCVGRGKLLKA
jgi:hypothetical protein